MTLAIRRPPVSLKGSTSRRERARRSSMIPKFALDLEHRSRFSYSGHRPNISAFREEALHMETKKEVISSNPAPSLSDSPAAPVVVDLGRKSRKQVKRLRRGGGGLLDSVLDAVSDLRRSGEISATAQPVIVVVREKRKRPKSIFDL
jgi:hypothetical protein